MATNEPPPPGYSLDDDEPVAHTAEARPAPSSTSPGPESAVTPPAAQRRSPPQAENTTQDPEAPILPERPHEDDDFADPQIASLHAIFPDFDAALLISVLESVGGSQDRAVDILLGMTDPDHVPTAQLSPPVATELDEEFARQLMLEDEQVQQRAAEPALGYEPRARGATWQPQGRNQGQGTPERDTMADVQEQFTKIAESGKRTFSSILSKVKAKYQEYDQNRSGQGPEAGTEPSWGAPSGQSGVDRHAQSAYYAPTSEYRPRRSSTRDYEEAPEQNIVPHRDNTSSPAGAPGDGDPALVSSSAGVGRDHPETPPPPSTNSGPPQSNISPGKFGLLPKRPVSLVNSEQPMRATVQDDDEDEELEYVENPFEETGRK
ncbi:hypothetical protein EWM64_g7655 [Hericium alpestre]|uniref:CUE domain-containing protein n=1 Tax=Hericium alpestre TaxID=135208 RepID=A0A4Y9ZRB3_9AGAM|nr:hypothetical protein EWM64_g7655 [Hericium alpestre]